MKKICNGIYTYKVINIIKDHKGYHGTIITEKHTLPINIDAPTQQGFKNVLNIVIRDYGFIKGI